MTEPRIPSSAASLDRRGFLRRLGTMTGGVALASIGGACDVREYARAHGAKLRLSIATGPIGGTYYVYGGGLASVISRHIPNVEATAELTSGGRKNLSSSVWDARIWRWSSHGTGMEKYSGTEVIQDPWTRARPCAGGVVHPANASSSPSPRRNIAALADLRGQGISTGRPAAEPMRWCHIG